MAYSTKKVLLMMFVIGVITAQFVTLPQFVAVTCNYDTGCIQGYPADLNPEVLASLIPKNKNRLFIDTRNDDYNTYLCPQEMILYNNTCTQFLDSQVLNRCQSKSDCFASTDIPCCL